MTWRISRNNPARYRQPIETAPGKSQQSQRPSNPRLSGGARHRRSQVPCRCSRYSRRLSEYTDQAWCGTHTKPGQYILTIGVNIVNTCKELAIDDVSLRPIGVDLKAVGIVGSFLAPSRLVGDNAPGYFGIFAKSSLK